MAVAGVRVRDHSQRPVPHATLGTPRGAVRPTGELELGSRLSECFLCWLQTVSYDCPVHTAANVTCVQRAGVEPARSEQRFSEIAFSTLLCRRLSQKKREVLGRTPAPRRRGLLRAQRQNAREHTACGDTPAAQPCGADEERGAQARGRRARPGPARMARDKLEEKATFLMRAWLPSSESLCGGTTGTGGADPHGPAPETTETTEVSEGTSGLRLCFLQGATKTHSCPRRRTPL